MMGFNIADIQYLMLIIKYSSDLFLIILNQDMSKRIQFFSKNLMNISNSFLLLKDPGNLVIHSTQNKSTSWNSILRLQDVEMQLVNLEQHFIKELISFIRPKQNAKAILLGKKIGIKF